MSETERTWMRRALELAERGRGFVEPNPLVGAVIIRDDSMIAEGWHQRYGGPHAEVHALQAAGEAARGATLFVTLEESGPARRLAGCLESMDLGMRATVALMPALGDHGIIANDDSTDERIRFDESPTSLRQLKGTSH